MMDNVKLLAFVFVFTLMFSFAEMIAGISSKSLLLIEESVHMFADSVSFGISLWAERETEKHASQKANLIGAGISLLTLTVTMLAVFIESLKRLVNLHEHGVVVDSNIMLVFGIVLCCFHLFCLCLYRMGFSVHSHGHAHGQNHGAKVLDVGDDTIVDQDLDSIEISQNGPSLVPTSNPDEEEEEDKEGVGSFECCDTKLISRRNSSHLHTIDLNHSHSIIDSDDDEEEKPCHVVHQHHHHHKSHHSGDEEDCDDHTHAENSECCNKNHGHSHDVKINHGHAHHRSGHAHEHNCSSNAHHGHSHAHDNCSSNSSDHHGHSHHGHAHHNHSHDEECGHAEVHECDGGGHGHSHGCCGMDHTSLNMASAVFHIFIDFLHSFFVVVTALILRTLGPESSLSGTIDAMASLLLAFVIGGGVLVLAREFFARVSSFRKQSKHYRDHVGNPNDALEEAAIQELSVI